MNHTTKIEILLCHCKEVQIEIKLEKGLEELVVFGGGIIPDQDIVGLKEIGVKEIFGPGTTTSEMIEWINANVSPK